MYDTDHFDEKLWRLYEQDDPVEVCERAWDILSEADQDNSLSATALWQLDTDSDMFVFAHRGLPEQFASLRLPKMDSVVGRAMVAGKPLQISDVQLSISQDPSLARLGLLEYRGLREFRARTVLFLPYQHLDEDYVLVLCFSEAAELPAAAIDAISRFGEHLVKAFSKAKDRSRQSALVKLGKLLSPAARIERGTMDRVAELVKETVRAGGVSIFLCSEENRRLGLVGSSPGIKGHPSYEKVYYRLEMDQGLTPGVVEKNEALRYSNLNADNARDELAALGYTWRSGWEDNLDYDPGKPNAFMAAPLRDPKTPKECIGVIRASLRVGPGCYFTPYGEEMLWEMAGEVARFVSGVRTAHVRAIEPMHLIAHQFISPLNTLFWHCYELRQGISDEARLQTVLDAIHSLGGIAVTYGRNFDLVARLWSGVPGDFAFMSLRLAPILIELARNYQPLAWHRHVGIRVVAKSRDADKSQKGSVDDLPEVWADRDALKQAFAIAIDNAVKYSMDGTTIVITGVRFLGKVNVHVTNISKIPVESKWRERIFELGERAPEARDIDVAGTGTGLWLARNVMRLHDGDIAVEPSEKVKDGWRTRFTLSLEEKEHSSLYDKGIAEKFR